MADEFKTPELDYTSRDYVTIRDEAVERIEFYTDDWTDHSPSDPGIVLLQLFSGMADVLHYYVDRQARESVITDVLGRRSAAGLAALVGDNLKGPSPSTTSVTLTLASSQVNPTPIPAGTILQTVGLSTNVKFETTEAATIPTGVLTIQGVPVVQGETSSSTTIGTSDGSSYQIYALPGVSVLDEGIVVSVNAVEWTYTDNFLTEEPDAQVWGFSRDEADTVFIRFGDGGTSGGTGLIPPTGQVISATWREGGGKFTNVGAGTIRTVTSTILSGGLPVSISATNPTAAFGGDEHERVSVARKRIPRRYRSNNRAVTTSDYQGQSESVPGVVHSLPLVTGVGSWTVYVAPSPLVGTGVGTDPFGYVVSGNIETDRETMALAVQQALDSKRMGTDSVLAVLTPFKPIDSTITINVFEGARRSSVESAFNTFVSTFFDVNNLSIGRTSRGTGDINLSDWYAGIDGLEGVDYVDVEYFNLRPMLSIPDSTTGDIVFSNVVYNDKTTDAIWEVQFISAAVFSVYRRDIVGGPRVVQSTLGAVGTTFTDDNEEIQFTIGTGAPTPIAGDVVSFRSSRKKGNIPILDGELGVQGIISYTIVGGV